MKGRRTHTQANKEGRKGRKRESSLDNANLKQRHITHSTYRHAQRAFEPTAASQPHRRHLTDPYLLSDIEAVSDTPTSVDTGSTIYVSLCTNISLYVYQHDAIEQDVSMMTLENCVFVMYDVPDTLTYVYTLVYRMPSRLQHIWTPRRCLPSRIELNGFCLL